MNKSKVAEKWGKSFFEDFDYQVPTPEDIAEYEALSKECKQRQCELGAESVWHLGRWDSGEPYITTVRHDGKTIGGYFVTTTDTLLEFLRKELEAWPEGVTSITQDPCGEIRGQTKVPHGDSWYWAHKCIKRDSPRVCDYETAFVTEDMWNG